MENLQSFMMFAVNLTWLQGRYLWTIQDVFAEPHCGCKSAFCEDTKGGDTNSYRVQDDNPSEVFVLAALTD